MREKNILATTAIPGENTGQLRGRGDCEESTHGRPARDFVGTRNVDLKPLQCNRYFAGPGAAFV